jgi:hypothetical protein
MSIFKETFRDYVRDQLSIRDKVISRGNSGTGDGATLPRRNQSNTVKLQSGKEVDLEAGAFYSLFNRQCVIRMTSMVDYVEDVGLDIGINNEDGTRSNSTFASIKGSALAQNFILQGGVLSDFARNVKGERVVKRVTTPRDSFPRPGQKTNLSYGDGGIVSDATSDGYGIVPMPGIIDANIRTKSAYGSLREAKVNFICHNQRQLEVLEMLYMRPGYMILLEWGWSPFVQNDGTLANEFVTVENSIGPELLFSNKVTSNLINKSISLLKEVSNGNYDGLLGYIKNFGFQARPDGGFDCYVELITAGEILDGLKVPAFFKGEVPKQSNAFNESALTGLIKNLTFVTTNAEDLSDDYIEDNFNALFNDNDFDPSLLKRIDLDTIRDSLSVGNVAGVLSGGDLGGVNLLSDVIETIIKKDQNNLLGVLATSLNLENTTEIKNYIITAGDKESLDIGTYEYLVTSITNQTGYIRWDALCVLINKYFIEKTEKDLYPVYLLPDKPVYKDNNTVDVQPLLYIPMVSVGGNQAIEDASCDSFTCILPNQFYPDLGDPGSVNYIESVLGNNIPDCQVWNPFYSIVNTTSPLSRPSTIEYDGIEIKTNNPKLFEEDAKRRIGNIFISISYLAKIASDNIDNEDYTVGQFVKDIWDGINEVCPNHNFQLHQDKETDAIYIIDLINSSLELPTLEDLYEFIPFSNENTLRSFNYESTVPSSLSSTVAIQAQNPRSINDIEGVTFAAFNRSIKNRVHTDSDESNFEEIQNRQREVYLRTVNEYTSLKSDIQQYTRNFWQIHFNRTVEKGAEENGVFGISRPTIVGGDGTDSNMVGKVKRFQTLQEYFLQSEQVNGNSSVIPLSFNADLDGISGIVIGNVFKIAEDRLPRAYKNANIGFIVFNEEQSITAGQDWITKIGGKMIILPKNKIEVGKLTNPIKNTNTTSAAAAAAGSSTATTTQAGQLAQEISQDTDLLDIYWAYEYQADLDLPTQLIIEVNPSKYGNSAIQNNSTNPNIFIGSGAFPNITLPVQVINFIGAGIQVSRSVGSGDFITVAPIYLIEIDDLNSNEISVKIYFEEVTAPTPTIIDPLGTAPNTTEATNTLEIIIGPTGVTGYDLDENGNRIRGPYNYTQSI